ncbi:dTDP-4-amino-4,6-dideoxygalactose transaminase [Tabrizicola sp.]|uniref:dTDP-4-amino-4,6-dideoxygalactose transaminase n=1 Tax=Tabrizicola sp. TaxID=2005166 RepID=UPI0025FDAB24|nr:dTDP-4-amino-4,6-dideoxygalactose transaminase [Tabrizicola sp.]
MLNIPFNRPSILGRELANVQAAVDLGQLSGDGTFTKACNQRIAEMTGANAALLTHSCTAALEMAALLCDLAPGDEVIMPSFTFVSTANAVALRGAVPVFVDIDPETLNIDPEAAARAVTSRTKAIFAVHYAGFPAAMDRLAETARDHGLMLVEDAAQALGSTLNGRAAGSLGDMAAFSFHETKNIISGEGGALTLMRSDLIERAEIIREKGTNRSRFLRGQVDKYTWVDLGSSMLPGELIAAFLAGQLDMAEAIRARRLAIYDRYCAGFADLEDVDRVRMPHVPQGVSGNGHMFYLLLRDIEDRDAFIAHMRAGGVVTPFHYVPLHSAPAGLRYGRADGPLPVTDDTSARLARLPMFWALEDDGVDEIIALARDYLFVRQN